jgi:hypothetical protein
VTWLARHANGMQCHVHLHDVLRHLSASRGEDCLQIDAATVVAGDWTFTRGGV